MGDTLTLVEAVVALDGLDRERLEALTITTTPAPPMVVCYPAMGCGQPISRHLTSPAPMDAQIAELEASELLGTLNVTHNGTHEIVIQTWSTTKESVAWRKRVSTSLLHPTHADLLRAAGQIKADTWWQAHHRQQLNEAIWRADGVVRGTTRSDLLGLAQMARSTFYSTIEAKPADYEISFEELPFDDPEPVAAAQPTTKPVEQPTEMKATVAPAPAPRAIEPVKAPRPAAAPAVKKAPARPSAGTVRDDARFTAPAVVLDANLVYCADGTTAPWEATHLGDLAMLTQTYRLGWGGGEDRLPDLGQIWLGPDALTRLGLPISLDVADTIVDQDVWARKVKEAFKQISASPVFTLAAEAGWEFSTVHAWTRVWHPEHLRAGAWIVAAPWQTIGRVALTAPAPGTTDAGLGDNLAAAPVLAARLREFAAATGVAYRLTPAATGLDLIDHTRPPRRDAYDDRGAGRNRAALIRGVAAEVPGFLLNTDDHRFANLEADFSWWRSWDSLPDSEKARKHVVAFDRGRSYLAPWSSLSLGLDGLQHHTEHPTWDGKENPGYWLIDCLAPGEWPWWLPDVSKSTGARVENDRMWVTTHTLRQLDMVGITARIHEAYTWDNTARYLEPASKQLRHALDVAQDPAVVATVKNLYTSTVGKLGQRDHKTHYHLWRPDWRHHIIAATRTAILRGLITAQETSGAIPLVVDRDTVMYAVDTDVVTQAWPGDPKKLGVGIGAWKPAYIADLATWGPTHLPGKGLNQRFRYTRAIDDMTPWRFEQ